MNRDINSNTIREQEDHILSNLPPAPPIFAPRGLALAAQIVGALATNAPHALQPILVTSTTVALAEALHDSAHAHDASGPLLPRHSQSNNRIPGHHYHHVNLDEMGDDWCRLATR